MYKKLTEEEKKNLECFPKYDDTKPESWLGSREYWESIFESESNRDPKLHDAFSELHHKIVNMIIQFCEEHELKDIDEFHIGADGLAGSYGHHEWTCFTDSSMSLNKLVKDGSFIYADRNNPFLFEI